MVLEDKALGTMARTASALPGINRSHDIANSLPDENVETKLRSRALR